MAPLNSQGLREETSFMTMSSEEYSSWVLFLLAPSISCTFGDISKSGMIRCRLASLAPSLEIFGGYRDVV